VIFEGKQREKWLFECSSVLFSLFLTGRLRVPKNIILFSYRLGGCCHTGGLNCYRLVIPHYFHDPLLLNLQHQQRELKSHYIHMNVFSILMYLYLICIWRWKWQVEEKELV
jgi:hypothetical protein